MPQIDTIRLPETGYGCKDRRTPCGRIFRYKRKRTHGHLQRARRIRGCRNRVNSYRTGRKKIRIFRRIILLYNDRSPKYRFEKKKLSTLFFSLFQFINRARKTSRFSVALCKLCQCKKCIFVYTAQRRSKSGPYIIITILNIQFGFRIYVSHFSASLVVIRR